MEYQYASLKLNWFNVRIHLNEILQKHQLTTIFPSQIDNENHNDILRDLESLKNTLNIKVDYLHTKITREQIKTHANKRCDQYKDQKKKMIDSIIDRHKQTIIIDRIIVKKNDTEELIIDPNEIKKYTNLHFQTIAGGIHEEKSIPSFWETQYQPKTSIDESIYTTLMDEPTEEEWSSHIKALPNNKASGPSGISNEMIKHLGENMQKVLRKFVAACFLLNDIPQAWRSAYVYPINKPKPWECRLTNTRPITLLDTTRKLAVRILNNRLSQILVTNNIKLNNQYAGLPNGSTFEPLRIINEILQDAKEYKKHLWILFQDLSKAYDRVNIFMLQKALKHFKIPETFITFITNIFTNRKNSIFTHIGITDPYDVLIGIDQGEVISPLI